MKRYLVVWFDPIDGLEFTKAYKDIIEAEGQAAQDNGKIIEIEVEP